MKLQKHHILHQRVHHPLGPVHTALAIQELHLHPRRMHPMFFSLKMQLLQKPLLQDGNPQKKQLLNSAMQKRQNVSDIYNSCLWWSMFGSFLDVLYCHNCSLNVRQPTCFIVKCQDLNDIHFFLFFRFKVSECIY